MIAWVEGSTPLYELYTNQQSKHNERLKLLALAAAAAQQQSAPGTKPGASKPQQQAAISTNLGVNKVQRPIDAFTATLKAVGIDTSTSRATWPLTKLREAFKLLMKGVHSSLLAEELMCGSAGAAHWWHRQQSYTSSTAAMSMVGFLLGLGDRHLDNILLERRNGGVVHVDFAIAFDRGLKLAVPELVPFRLTQVMARALGATGIQGRFRAVCESVLGCARSHEDTLSSLLDSMVRDPWVEWNWEVSAREAKAVFEWVVEVHLALAEFTHKALGGNYQDIPIPSGSNVEASEYTVLENEVVEAFHLVGKMVQVLGGGSLGQFVRLFSSAAEQYEAVAEGHRQAAQVRYV